MKKAILCFLFFSFAQVYAQVTFKPVTSYSLGSSPESICSEDFNGDGIVDLVTANPIANNVAIFLGTGTGTFGTPSYVSMTYSSPESVCSGDFNGDGKADLAVAESSFGSISILLGTGTGTFGAVQDYWTNGMLNPYYVITADLNNDGKLDLASTDAGANSLNILLGAGTGTFTPLGDFTFNNSPGPLVCADFNGDGTKDIATVIGNSNSVAVKLGTGTGSFGSAAYFAAGTNPVSLTCGDFNGDGTADLATANNDGAAHTWVLLGAGTGTFGTATSYPLLGTPTFITSADINSDGNLDLVPVSRYSDLVSVALGTGTGSFCTATNVNIGTASNPHSAACADFNGDGKIDIAAAAYSTKKVAVLINDINSQITAPGTIVCPGTSGITLTAPGGYTAYSWSGSGIVSATNMQAIQVDSAGIYSVIATGSCGDNTTFTINATSSFNAAPNVSVSAADSICNGQSAVMTAFGAASYLWSSNAGYNVTTNTVSVNPSANITYTVTGVDANGCGNTATHYVKVKAVPVITITGHTLTCSGQADTLIASGATTYTWSSNEGGDTTATVYVSPITTQAYTVTGAQNSCSSAKTFNVTVPSAVTVTGTTVICSGNSTVLTAHNASTYTWSTGSNATTITVTPTSSSVYTLSGTSSGCTSSTTVAITVNPSPTLSISGTNTICVGSPTILTANGATTYTWSANAGSAHTNTVSLSPGSNTTYTVTGATGTCTASKTITVTVNPIPTLTISGSTTACAGSLITLTVSGATTYTWSSNAGSVTTNTAAVSSSTNATYTANGSSAAGCVGTKSYSVAVTALPTITITGTDTVYCNTSTVLSGSGASTYTWSSNAGSVHTASASVTPSITTVYTLTGTANNCPNTATFTVVARQVPKASFVKNLSQDCSTTASFTNTSLCYTSLNWDFGDGTTSTSANPVHTFTLAGTYTVTLKACNSNGCDSISQTVTNIVPQKPVTACTPNYSNQVGTFGYVSDFQLGNNILMSHSGGFSRDYSCIKQIHVNAASSYDVYTSCGGGFSTTFGLWIDYNNNGIFTQSEEINMTAGTVSLIYGSFPTYFNFTVPTSAVRNVPLRMRILSYDESYDGYNYNGCNFSWGGIHDGYYQDYTVFIDDPLPVANFSATPTSSCIGSTISFTNTSNYSSNYTWDFGDGDTSNQVNPVHTYAAAGTYSIKLKACSASVCTTTTKANYITVHPNVFSSQTISRCVGQTLTVGSHTYTSSGTYVDTLSSSYGCDSIITTNLTVNSLPVVTANATQTIVCSGTSVTLTGSGAVSYSWSGGISDGNAFSATTSQTYTVTGTDVNNCLNIDTVTITVNPLPGVTANATHTSVCAGDSLILYGGGAVTYAWSPLVNNGVIFAPTTTQNYTVSGTDNNNCVNTATITIIVNPQPQVGANATQTNVCAGTSVILTGSGAASYTWSNGVTDGVNFIPDSSRTYTVWGADLSGCWDSASVLVDVDPFPIITLSGDTIICNNGSTTLTASGALNYTWYPGLYNGNSLTFAPTVTTTYTVGGANTACSVDKVFTIEVQPCVWPGDADENLSVDNYDLLPVGIKYGQTGAARTVQGNIWQGDICSNWNDSLSNGTNTKYADCNGDGSINMNDTLAIHINYGSTHALKGYPPNTASANKDIFVQFNRASYSPGDTVYAYVNVGSGILPQTNFYGTAFTLLYDNSQVQPGSEEFYFNNSWIGTINQSKIKFARITGANGKVDASVVRVTHTDTSGYGQVATFRFILSSSTTYAQLYLTIAGAAKTDHLASLTNLNTGVDSATIIPQTTIVDPVNSSRISLFPNPSHNVITITADTDLGQVIIYNALGAKVYEELYNKNNAQIDLSAFPAGVYSFRIKGTATKVIKQ